MNHVNQPPVIENNPNPNDQKGASLVEYALLIALVAVVAISAMRGLGNQVNTSFSQTSSSMTFAEAPPSAPGDVVAADNPDSIEGPGNITDSEPPRN